MAIFKRELLIKPRNIKIQFLILLKQCFNKERFNYLLFLINGFLFNNTIKY